MGMEEIRVARHGMCLMIFKLTLAKFLSFCEICIFDKSQQGRGLHLLDAIFEYYLSRWFGQKKISHDRIILFFFRKF